MTERIYCAARCGDLDCVLVPDHSSDLHFACRYNGGVQWRGTSAPIASPSTHLLDRTSPMGGPFVGRCRLCGRDGLAASAALERCDNPQDVSADEIVVQAVTVASPSDTSGERERRERDEDQCEVCAHVRWRHGMSTTRFVPVCTACVEYGKSGDEHAFIARAEQESKQP